MNWIIASKVFQMILGFFVSVISARYLGPSNLGIINYTYSYVTFVNAIIGLGIDSYITKGLIDHKDNQGEVLGSAMFLRTVAAVFGVIVLYCILCFTDSNDSLIQAVAFLQGLNMIFSAGTMLTFWYQIQLRSKIPSMVMCIAYAIMTVYKVVILVQQKDIRYFAFTGSLETLLAAAFLISIYTRDGGPKLSIHRDVCRELLKNSYHFILANLMLVVYTQTDKIMLKQMLSDMMTGYYSLANQLCNMWPFVLMAIIDSISPLILEAKSKDDRLYKRRIRQCYASVIWLSVTVSLVITVLAPYFVPMLYGDEYQGSVVPVQILTWASVFTYLGKARGAWVVSEKVQHYEKYLTGLGAILNIFINWLLIPKLGASGAAMATVITSFTVNFCLMFLFRGLRENGKLILESVVGKEVIQKETVKQLVDSVFGKFKK